MYFYFSGDYPAALKLNGIYMGAITHSAKFCKADPDNPPFVEIITLSGGTFDGGGTFGAEKQDCAGEINGESEQVIFTQPFAFLPNARFLSCPPPNMTVTDLKGGYFLRVNNACMRGGFSVIAQQKYKDAAVTVLRENGLKISIETACDFYAEGLPFDGSSADVYRIKGSGDKVIAIAIYGRHTQILCYAIGQKISKILSLTVDGFDVQNGLSTIQKKSDIAKHVITSTWDFKDEKAFEISRKVTCSPNFSPLNLPDKLLPYAFLEEILCGGNASPYLGGQTAKNADRLHDYLGEFIGIMPPPTFRNFQEIGLIYPVKSNVYSVKYATFDVEGNKIVNLRIADN